ncbi:hypothetical protein [Pseudomonas phage vB_PaeM_PS119XW]|uniref:Uncharacterized protein n=2 Tax=root TaxID=1 RepID=A0A5C1K735_9CAUD|nr:virion structural protein [Pseudomonas phage vB_PaeM_PS119XW]QEM41958.1 hypothetical protein [Pseudomonas phage vB_PaeM_PS119XW]
MAYANPDKQPGAYPSTQVVKWTFDSNVATNGVAYSVNGLPPVVSEYIAYDSLSPPTPFIAVTQDGNGNVVYDGGFPKFMNPQAANISMTQGVLDFSARLQPDANGLDLCYYEVINNKTYIVKSGDVLVYDHYVFDDAYFGLDCTVYDETGNNPVRFRDYSPVIKDNGNPATATHPVMCRDRPEWKNKWVTRTVPLEAIVGKRLSTWTVAFENDADPILAREYRGQLRNARVLNGTTVAFDVMTDNLVVNPTTPQDWIGSWTVTRKRYLGPGKNLNSSQTYFKNCLDFIANPAKVASGNKNILVLGDATTGSYALKTAFNEYITKVAGAGGFTCTLKDQTDYDGTHLNPTLTELNNYAGLVFVGSLSDPDQSVNGKFTKTAVQDILTYRKAGNGIFIFTDHGPAINSIEEAYPVPTATNCFFVTANQLAVNFNAYFNGSVDRSNVNVGFIRSTYGDHVLYNDLTDGDFIVAGGSESSVVVKEVVFQKKDPVTLTLNPGKHTVNFLLKLTNGDVVPMTFVYLIGAGKYVIFRDNKGVEITQLLNDISDIADIVVELDGTSVGSMIADIFRVDITKVDPFRDIKVGTAVYDPATGSHQTIYPVDGIYVNNADLIKVRITQPFTYEATLPVTRYQPPIAGKYGRAENTLPLMPRYKTGGTTTEPIYSISHIQVPRRIIEEIQVVRPVYNLTAITQSVADHFKNIISYFAGELPRNEGQAFAYKTAADTSAALARLSPPTPKQIFDTWDRFYADEYFAKGQGIPPFLSDGTTPHPAGRWYWDDTIKAAVMPDNTSSITGFLSDEEPEQYTLEVTCQSNNGDDDFLGVVLAFVKEGDQSHHLTLALSRSNSNGNGRGNEAQNIIYDLSMGTRQNIISVNTGDYSNQGWNGAFKRVKVIRTGDIFNISISKWGTTEYDPTLSMTVDLNSDPLLAKFKGPKKYGYMAFSQPQSYFKDIVYTGLPRNIVCDMGSNKVYSWNGTGWVLMQNTTPKTIYGAPRVIRSFEDPTQAWRIPVNGTPVPVQ